jgi:hypothetical protein
MSRAFAEDSDSLTARIFDGRDAAQFTAQSVAWCGRGSNQTRLFQRADAAQECNCDGMFVP